MSKIPFCITKIIALIFLCTLSPFSVSAQTCNGSSVLRIDTKFSAFTSKKHCVETLGDHSGFCYKIEKTQNRFGEDKWLWDSRIKYFPFDFDEDGELDFFVSLQVSGWCGSAGCSNMVFLSSAQAKEIMDKDLFGAIYIAHSLDSTYIICNEEESIASLAFGDPENIFKILDRQ